MARNQILSLFSVFFLFFISLEFVTSAHHEEKKQIYIVYLGSASPRDRESQSAHYSRILEGVGVTKESLVRSYTKSFSGFAAYVTEKQQKSLDAHDEVISVFPSRNLQLLTTQSWDFMGFPVNVSRNPRIESDIIVGLLDSGIWHTSASFSDNGLGPPPKKWKGVCDGGKNFTCNNKIIGARVYVDESALDTVGHGTHTASIAAGNEVHNASFFGIANGTARGAVPSARIAVYKVCTANECSDHNILSAFDDAISDGVDILSVSLGGFVAQQFLEDSIAIGALHAFGNGILTLHAAGNSASFPLTSSVAPWLFSVAAGTTSRQIMNKIQLGNGNEESGYSINSFNLDGKKFPLINGIDASDSRCHGDTGLASACGCLDSAKVRGKIVLCNKTDNTSRTFIANATGAIMQLPGDVDRSSILSFPASLLRPQEFELVQLYYNSTKNATASIFKSQSTINKTAPVVAFFSSRGPNRILPEILKPDITAPGVNILAAYSPVVSPSEDVTDTRSTPYNIMSGTSMACPHVAGAAAYVKSNHPNWSPSAIKSALMTTAKKMNNSESEDTDMEFSYGSGFLDPVKASNPGLVYDATKRDYIQMLCNTGFSNKTIGRMFGDNTTCPKEDASTPKDLNYPTMAIQLHSYDETFSVKFPRTVTNVGQPNSTYKATLSQNPKLNITVEPSVLSFKELNEKQSFVVSISGNSPSHIRSVFVSLEWSDGIHIVRSPIVLYN